MDLVPQTIGAGSYSHLTLLINHYDANCVMVN